jgi:hypothetical protein
MVFQTNVPDTFQEGHLYIWQIYLITVFGCRIFENLGRMQNAETYRNPASPVRTQNILKIYVR